MAAALIENHKMRTFWVLPQEGRVSHNINFEEEVNVVVVKDHVFELISVSISLQIENFPSLPIEDLQLKSV